MPVTPTDLREIHGPVYVTETNDGTIIPWRPLSIGDYLEYDRLFRNGQVDHTVLENEIFIKCVTDPVLVKNIDLHKAGTITTVVSTIMSNSSIEDIDAFNKALDLSRELIQHPIHQLVSVVCRAFPSYTPDDIYKMDFPTMMFRVAQAEDKLLQLGGIAEPIVILKPGEEQPKGPQRPEPQIDPQKIKEAFDLQSGPGAKPKKKVNLSKQVEIDELDLGSTKEGERFVVNTGLMVTGMELGDENDARQMQRDIKTLYGDYLKQGNKVQIKTVDERIAEAKKRSEANRQKLIKNRKNR